MSIEYHCLVAGLPDLFFDASKLSLSLTEFRDYLREELKGDDYNLIGSFFWRYDNQNLLAILEEKEHVFHTKGNLSKEDFDSIFILVKDEALHTYEKTVPDYFTQFINAYKSDSPAVAGISWENQLTELYYNYLFTLPNEFLRLWYRFEADLANILTAYNCKKFDINTENELIGNNELSERLIKTNARDLGIGNEFPKAEQLMRILEEPNLIEREKKIDLLKWDILDEWTFFYYFTIERIFSYMLKLEMIERWTKLDRKTGEEMFNKLLNNLETSYTFPEEFSQKK